MPATPATPLAFASRLPDVRRRYCGLPVDRPGGRTTRTLPTGSNDVYVVRNGDEEILLPALASVVQAIDTDQRRMTVILPEGL